MFLNSDVGEDFGDKQMIEQVNRTFSNKGQVIIFWTRYVKTQIP